VRWAQSEAGSLVGQGFVESWNGRRARATRKLVQEPLSSSAFVRPRAVSEHAEWPCRVHYTLVRALIAVALPLSLPPAPKAATLVVAPKCWGPEDRSRSFNGTMSTSGGTIQEQIGRRGSERVIQSSYGAVEASGKKRRSVGRGASHAHRADASTSPANVDAREDQPQPPASAAAIERRVHPCRRVRALDRALRLKEATVLFGVRLPRSAGL
jgi:hypothetical protein